METFVILRHPVTILFTDFTNPDNLTNDFLILNPLFSSEIQSRVIWNVEIYCDTLLLGRAWKQNIKMMTSMLDKYLLTVWVDKIHIDIFGYGLSRLTKTLFSPYLY